MELDFPPGINANGTEYSRRGNWIDGSRVRWHDGAIRPIGGWSPFGTNTGPLDPLTSTQETEVFRAALSYKLNDGTGMFVAGSNEGLKAWSRGTKTVYDITPADFTSRPKETEQATGYGMWFYGVDAYGTERQGAELDLPDTFRWNLATWGQNLLAAPNGAPSVLYEWEPTFASPAVPVTNAPTNFDCFTVTAQRMVMMAGSDLEPRRVQWCDQENNTDWNFASQLNTAGFNTLPGTGRFKAIVSVQDRYLLVSESDAYVAQYVGSPYIYGFDSAGDNCGTIAGAAVVTTEDFAVWPGPNTFYMYDGSVVRPVPCSVMERFRKNLNRTHASKTVGFVNPGYSEIWWLYQEGNEDIDSYVMWNWETNYWSLGRLERTAASGNAALGGLFMIGADGNVYNHELPDVLPIDVSVDEVFLESGPIEAPGEPIYINSIIPDYNGKGVVAMTIFGQDRPNAPKLAFGPYLLTYPSARGQPVPTRARGHLISVRIEGVDGAWVQGSVVLNATNNSRRKK